MATRLERSYFLNNRKTMEGMAKAVEGYFRNFKGTDVNLDKKSMSAIYITCMTKPVYKSIRGILAQSTGHDLNMTVRMYQEKNKVKVEYDQEIDEGRRAFGAVVWTMAGVGILNLHGIAKRHGIPGELNNVITAYLKS